MATAKKPAAAPKAPPPQESDTDTDTDAGEQTERRAALAKACECTAEEVLSWRDYEDKVVVVVCRADFCGKVELPL